MTVVRTGRFKKDYKKLASRGKRCGKLKTAIELLHRGEQLPPGNRDHALTGNLEEYRECHIEPDCLLIYRIEKEPVN